MKNEALHTILLVAILAGVLWLLMKPQDGRFQPVGGDWSELAIDTKTGKACRTTEAINRPITQNIPLCSHLP